MSYERRLTLTRLLRGVWCVVLSAQARIEVTAAMHEDADTALARVPLEMKLVRQMRRTDRLSNRIHSNRTHSNRLREQKAEQKAERVIVLPPPRPQDIRSSAPWVECPSVLLAAHGTRSFEVRVDALKLPPGLHSAEVVGVERGAEWRGPLFRVPVTVTAPLALAAKTPFGNSVMQWVGLSFTPGEVKRHFVVVPEGATWRVTPSAPPHTLPNHSPGDCATVSLSPDPSRLANEVRSHPALIFIVSNPN